MDFGDTRRHQRIRPPLVPSRTCDDWSSDQTSGPRPVTLSSEGRPLLAVSGSLRVPAEVSSHVLWIACDRLPLRGYRGLGQSVAPVMCLAPCSYLSSGISEIAKEPCPSCGSGADWRASVSGGPGSGNKSCSGWTCKVENAVVGMSATLAEETAVKDPEDDEAFRAKDKQMGVEWFDGLRTRQRKRRGLVLSRKLKPRLWQTTERQQSLLSVLLLSESRARRCSHGPYWCGRSRRRMA